MTRPKLKIDLVSASAVSRWALTDALEAIGAYVRPFAAVEELFTSAGRSTAPVVVDLQCEQRMLDDTVKMLFRRRRTIATAAAASIDLAVEVMREGASYFLEQPLCPDQLGLALAACAGGDHHDSARLFGGLSARERQVLEGVCLGETNKISARRLGISPRTVECHRARLRTRLGAHNLPALIGLVFDPAERRSPPQGLAPGSAVAA